MLLAEKSSDVRQDWSRFVDEVIHKSPKFVQRNERDIFVSMNLEYMAVIMDSVRYCVEVEYDDESKEFIATMQDFWFVEASETEEKVVQKLADQLMDFAADYYKDLTIYQATKDFKKQFPLILKALITDDTKRIIDFFDVKYV